MRAVNTPAPIIEQVEDRFGFTFQPDRSLKDFRPAPTTRPQQLALFA